jgi:hypothetical protein
MTGETTRFLTIGCPLHDRKHPIIVVAVNDRFPKTVIIILRCGTGESNLPIV